MVLFHKSKESSHEWLQDYLNEWTWRYNRRDSETPMFRDLLTRAVSRTVY